MKENNVVIKTENLTKRYNGFTAVNKLNLEIYKGEIFGLLGPNGAGKTTTILMLLGLTEPTEGKAYIEGYDCTRNPMAVKSVVGYLPDNVGFYEDLTGKENLRYTGQLNGMDPDKLEKRIDMLIERVGLTEAADNKVGTYSRGMRQRLGIADVLIKDPKIVILDEPTLGIDPEGVKQMLSIITQLSIEDKRTVLISSHLLHQIQQICNRVGIFVRGELIACGQIENLAEQVSEGKPKELEIRVDCEKEDFLSLVKGFDAIDDIKYQAGLFTITSKKDIRKELVAAINSKGYSLMHLRLRGADLDDIYSQYFAGEGVIK
ncbi:MAG TPA: ABC transporter ATP-binding protein [Clostridiales bacterium]|nr:ABC transporter ATP-binding protein [Clostridiales bacterium]